MDATSGWRRTRIGLPPPPSSVPALPLSPLSRDRVWARAAATIGVTREDGVDPNVAKVDIDVGKYQLGWSGRRLRVQAQEG